MEFILFMAVVILLVLGLMFGVLGIDVGVSQQAHTHKPTASPPPHRPNNPRYGCRPCLAATFVSASARTRPRTPHR